MSISSIVPPEGYPITNRRHTKNFMSITNKHQLLQLLEKHRLGTCTQAEEAMLQAWFEQVPVIEELTFASEEEKEQIKGEIRSAIKATINNPAPAVTKPFLSRKRWWTVSAAAAVAILLSVFALYTFFEKGESRMLAVTAPEGINKLPVTLPDSSVVWLSGGSTLQYPEKFEPGFRKVILDGVAYFSVHHDKTAPFTVKTAKALSVKVLGTSFVVDVKAKADLIKVSVLTGLVQIDEDQSQLGLLSPGERLSYSCLDKTFFKETYQPEEVKEWRDNGIIYLNNASLQEVAVVLQTMYRTKLKFDKQQTAQYRFNMSFSRELTIDQVLGMLGRMSGLQFDRKNNEVVVNNK